MCAAVYLWAITSVSCYAGLKNGTRESVSCFLNNFSQTLVPWPIMRINERDTISDKNWSRNIYIVIIPTRALSLLQKYSFISANGLRILEGGLLRGQTFGSYHICRYKPFIVRFGFLGKVEFVFGLWLVWEFFKYDG